MKALVTIVAIVTLLAGFSAQADGFVCLTEEGDLRLAAYNKIYPREGTRNPAVMIASNPALKRGLQTITKFLSESGTLSTDTVSTDHLTYIGNVDLRLRESGAADDYILGTQLREVAQVTLKIDFAYGDDLDSGDKTGAIVTLVKHDGIAIERFAACERYLKSHK